MMAKKKTLQELNKPPVNAITETINRKEVIPAIQAPPIPANQPGLQDSAYVPEFGRDPDTGAINSVKMPNGEMFLGTSQQVKEMAGVWAGQRALPPGGIEASAVAAKNAMAAQKLQVQQQQQDIMAAQAPQSNELSPQVGLSDSILSAVPGGKLVSSAFEQVRMLAYGAIPQRTINRLEAAQAVNPTRYNAELLKEIEKARSEKELSLEDRWGAVVENMPTLPIIGNVGKWMGNPDTPSDTVKDLRNQMADSKAYVRSVQRSATAGTTDPIEAYNLIEAQENQINKLESKIKIMVANSEQLKANPEVVNSIETEILTTRQFMLASKATSLGGINKNPTSEELIAQLDELYSE